MSYARVLWRSALKNAKSSNLPLVRQQSRIIALCAYRDMSGMFTIENKASCSAKEDAVVRSHSEAETIIQELRWDVGKSKQKKKRT